MKWYRHVNPSNGYWYDFMAENMETALVFAKWKFVSQGIIGEIADYYPL